MANIKGADGRVRVYLSSINGVTFAFNLSVGRIIKSYSWSKSFKNALAYFHYNSLLELYYQSRERNAFRTLYHKGSRSLA